MKALFTTTALIALVAGSAPAMAQCNVGETTTYTQEDNALRQGARRDLRQIRNAAMLLSRYGKEDTCQQVVSAIEEIRGQGGMAAADQAEGQQADAEMQARAEQQDYKQIMAQAQPVNNLEQRLTTEELMEADVRGSTGEVVGEITNIVLNDDGKPSHAVIAFGGLLGLGEDRVAVPYEKIRVRREAGDQDDMVFFVPMTDQQLENAPRVQADDDGWFDNDDWVQQNAEYYDNNTVEVEAG